MKFQSLAVMALFANVNAIALSRDENLEIAHQWANEIETTEETADRQKAIQDAWMNIKL